MVNDKETKSRLLKCAMAEFAEKGFMKASLRNICKEAGVTTGALYFFFEDKEDLFGSLVNGPLLELEGIITEHFSMEMEASDKISKGEIDMSDFMKVDGHSDDIDVAMEILRCLFAHREAFELLLAKAQGTKYENMPDKMVDIFEKHYSKMFAVMKGYKSARELTKEDRFIIHWMSHDQIDIFVHVVTHCNDIREAERHMKNMMAYIIGGWCAVVSNR